MWFRALIVRRRSWINLKLSKMLTPQAQPPLSPVWLEVIPRGI